MADVMELSAADLAVAERMTGLPGDVLGVEDDEPVRDGDATAADEIPEVEAADEGGETEGEEGKSEEQDRAQFDVDQEFEVPDGDGTRTVKLSDLLAIEQEFTAFKDDRTATLQRVETQAREQANQWLTAQRDAMVNVGHQLQAVLQMVQPPPPPDLNMLNPRSQNYDPEQYMLQKAQHDSIMGQFQQVQRHAQEMGQRAKYIEAQQANERDERELAALQRAWPEFAKPETQQQVIADAQKFYRVSFEQLDDGFNYGWQGEMLRDAIAYRRMKAGGGDVKAKVVAKAQAAKATRSETGGKSLTSEQSSYMNARKALKANGKDNNAAAKAWMKFVD